MSAGRVIVETPVGSRWRCLVGDDFFKEGDEVVITQDDGDNFPWARHAGSGHEYVYGNLRHTCIYIGDFEHVADAPEHDD